MFPIAWLSILDRAACFTEDVRSGANLEHRTTNPDRSLDAALGTKALLPIYMSERPGAHRLPVGKASPRQAQQASIAIEMRNSSDVILVDVAEVFICCAVGLIFFREVACPKLQGCARWLSLFVISAFHVPERRSQLQSRILDVVENHQLATGFADSAEGFEFMIV